MIYTHQLPEKGWSFGLTSYNSRGSSRVEGRRLIEEASQLPEGYEQLHKQWASAGIDDQ